MAKREVRCIVTLSYDDNIPAAEARRELRTRVNEGCCYSHDQSAVRVKKITRLGPPPAR